MFTFVGDTVLDPFLGSGTTSLAAKNLVRNSIGYEINADFLPIIQNKLGVTSRNLFSDNTAYEIIVKKNLSADFSHKIESLPYVFKDKVRFDKKNDPRKLSFGSKVSGDEHKREEYYSVKRILSPEVIELNTGVQIRLIGVKTVQEKSKQAIEYLARATKGRRVFLKFDSLKHDNENRLFAYVYLKNKTFVNAHLLKRKLAVVDLTMDFKLKDKFVRILIEADSVERKN
jgi:site-specific DNA-methyltransferase (adenine-specific)